MTSWEEDSFTGSYTFSPGPHSYRPSWDYSYESHLPLPPTQYSSVPCDYRVQCATSNNVSTEMSVRTGFTKPCYKYTLKVINPGRKTDFLLRKLSISRQFTCLDDAKAEIGTAATTEVVIKNFGYVVPGHGWKGRQELLDSDEDIAEMYTVYGKKSDILLWCHGVKQDSEVARKEKPKKKRPHSPDSEGGPSRSKKEACARKLAEVEKIVTDLKEKHGNNFTIEKLNAWAHMVHMGKHGSLETPPNLPYFGGRKSKSDSQIPTPSSTETGKPGTCMSPGKRINLRSECMDQLNKWHALLEKGAITQSQYDDFQKKILGDIADL